MVHQRRAVTGIKQQLTAKVVIRNLISSLYDADEQQKVVDYLKAGRHNVFFIRFDGQ